MLYMDTMCQIPPDLLGDVCSYLSDHVHSEAIMTLAPKMLVRPLTEIKGSRKVQERC